MHKTGRQSHKQGYAQGKESKMNIIVGMATIVVAAALIMPDAFAAEEEAVEAPVEEVTVEAPAEVEAKEE